MEINVMGSIYAAKYVSILMSKMNKGEEKGVIIFVSSTAADAAQRGQVAYGASKGAIDAITLPMARDLGKYGIRVMAIAPGIFESPL